MPRTLNGADQVVAARKQVMRARTADELREAQAVLLPLDLGLTIAQTAQAIGRSVGVTSTLRNRFGKAKPGIGNARAPRPRTSVEPAIASERKLLANAINDATAMGDPSAAGIKAALQKRTGTPMSLATVYRILTRHGWRKNAPFPAALP